MFEFKRTTDTSETYYEDMKLIAPHTHLGGFERPGRRSGMGGEVLPLVSGHRSVRGKKWLEVMKTFKWNKHRGWQKNHLQTG